MGYVISNGIHYTNGYYTGFIQESLLGPGVGKTVAGLGHTPKGGSGGQTPSPKFRSIEVASGAVKITIEQL